MKNEIQNLEFLQFTIAKLHYNQLTRNLEITDAVGSVHKFPKETEWKKIPKPGLTLQLGTYSQDGQPFKIMRTIAGDEIGHYGPIQKAQRDSFYKFETSRKASDLIREEQLQQAAEGFYDDN